MIAAKTGLRLNPYFSASKIRFILERVKGAEEKAQKGDLYFGTVDSWIIFKMTNGKNHFTDVSNASRTMLYNIFDMSWDKDLLALWKIPEAMLPEVKENSATMAKRHSSMAGFISLGSPATSKPLSLANAAIKKAKARIPMAPAASC
jgi:glycerol kinase